MNNNIIIKGAKEHNLKNINLEIPRDKLVVITGLSGSGKSSLAFDTLYAEGQRRICRELIFICKTVFRTDGKARCRANRGTFASNINRPKNYI